MKILRKALTTILCGGLMFTMGCSNNSSSSSSAATAENNTTTTTPATTTAATTTTYKEATEYGKVIALTFDDGPNVTTTNQVLDVLEKYNVRASFFLVGNNISEGTADVVKRAYDMGCEIDNHSQTHSYMNKMEADEIQAEVKFTSDKVEEITGVPTKFFRPPYIAVNSTMYDNITMPFICGAGCDDWDEKVDVQTRIDKTLEQACDGEIILLHDAQGNDQTVEALDTIIPSLLEEGYELVTVGELFHAKGVEPFSGIVYSNALQ